MTRCTLYNVQTQPVYDVIMVIVLQLCYETMNESQKSMYVCCTLQVHSTYVN